MIENSWNGTEFERLKDYTRQMAALTFVMPGMPLIYNGQEVGFNRRLEFFEKDIIDWKDSSDYTVFYKN
jgi:Alpha amylase, catalytic domain.